MPDFSAAKCPIFRGCMTWPCSIKFLLRKIERLLNEYAKRSASISSSPQLARACICPPRPSAGGPSPWIGSPQGRTQRNLLKLSHAIGRAVASSRGHQSRRPRRRLSVHRGPPGLLHDELERIWSNTGRTIIFVTHNVREAVRLGDRVVLLTFRPGRVKSEFPINLPRPRSLEDPTVALAAREVLDELRDDINRSLDAEYNAGVKPRIEPGVSA